MMVRLNHEVKRAVDEGWQNKTITLTQAQNWLEGGGNIGLQAGPRSGWLGFVDLDDLWARLLAPHFLPPTQTAGKEKEEHPSHYVYISEGLNYQKYKNCDGGELIAIKAASKGQGHYVAVAPSTHPTKGKYLWVGGFNPSKITRISNEDLERRVSLLAAATLIAKYLPEVGGRHHFSLALFGFLIRNGLDADEATELAIPAWRVHGAIEADGGGLRRNAHDTARKLKQNEPVTGGGTLSEYTEDLPRRLGEALGWNKRNMQDGAKSYFRSDYGNGQRFVDRYSKMVHWVPTWKKWLVWDGSRWELDTGEQVTRLAHSTALHIYDEAKNTEDQDEQKAIAKFAIQSQARVKIEAMLASAAPYLTVQHTELDKDPWLLNVENGTLDLRTGELKSPDPKDLIMKIVPVRFNPDAGAPIFTAFLERILPEESVRSFMERAVGLALTGITTEHVLPFLYGTGANGKTTLINAVLQITGDYGQQAAPDLLLAKSGAHPTELADLFGARFVASVEVEDGRRLAESLIKQLTGGDRIKARRMHENFWEFDPTHKVFLAANHKPVVRGTDHGIWRRVKLIPFEVTIPDDEQDKDLPDKLKAELSGILAWAVRGCLEWQEHGLEEPEAVTKATREYRSEMDVLAAFLEEECYLSETAETTSKALWNAWRRWAEEAGEKAGTQTAFGRRLAERGLINVKTGPRKDRKGWRGIGLLTRDEYAADGKGEEVGEEL